MYSSNISYSISVLLYFIIVTLLVISKKEFDKFENNEEIFSFSTFSLYIGINSFVVELIFSSKYSLNSFKFDKMESFSFEEYI